MLDLCLANSWILYFCYILESIYKFITELHVLEGLFVTRSNKKQRRCRIISNFTKGETFPSLNDNQVLLGVISQCGPPCFSLQKMPSSPFQFGQEDIISGHSIESRAYWFILKISRIYPILTSRNRMMNFFIIVNITPTYKI